MTITAQKLIDILNTHPKDPDFAILTKMLNKGEPEAEVNIDEVYIDPLQLLIYCAQQNYYDTTKLLLENGANPNVPANSVSAIHCATMEDNVEMIKLLNYYGADLNAQDTEWHTALCLSITHKKPKALQYLMHQKAVDPNASAYATDTPIYLAYEEGYITLMYLLIKKGANFANFKQSLVDQKACYLSSEQEYNLSGDTTEELVTSESLC